MTSEQLIILGFLAAAFVVGWLARAATEPKEHSDVENQRAEQAVAGEPHSHSLSPLAERFEGAVHESRRELERAIRAYHAAVASSLGDGSAGAAGGPDLDVLPRALVALAVAVDHASLELQAEDPLAERLQTSAADLRRLAQDVALHSTEEALPAGVFDRLEQHLMSAAATILSSARLQPQPS